MAMLNLRYVAAVSAANVLLLFALSSAADAADGPNRVTPSDVAAGRWVDSLLDPKLSKNPARSRRTAAPQQGAQRRVSRRKSGLRGKLVKNPNTNDGSPPYALVDRVGGLLRYVEPVESIDLNAQLGKVVAVRHDTGNILLASQLALPRTGRAKASTGVELAQNLEPIPAGEPVAEGESLPTGEAIGATDPSADGDIIYEGPVYLDGGYEHGHDDGIDFGGCPSCGSYVCKQFGGCGRGSRGKAYVRGDYLLWWFDGMDTPPLVTQSDPIDGGVLPNFPGDNPSTVVLFGGDDVLTDPRSGGRVLFGVWLDDAGRQGLEFDYLRFGEESLTFSAAGEDGNPTISRPFFDLFPDDDDNGIIDIPPSEAAEQVSSAILDGRVTVRIDSEFESFGVRFRHNLCCCPGCSTGCGSGVGCGGGVGCGSGVGGGCGGGTRRVDLLTGFRYAKLEESLGIREDLVVDADDVVPPPVGLIIPPDGTQFIVNDLFETENEFIGGELGFIWEIEHQRWTLELLSKLAIGNNRQRVRIDGSTEVILDPPAANPPPPSEGGLLAQSTNIGNYERDEFSVMPEVGFTLGYRLRPRFKINVGYTLLYWTNVLRPGEQIDREINGTLIPDQDALGDPVVRAAVPPLRPEFVFQNTNLWAHGINVGGEYRW